VVQDGSAQTTIDRFAVIDSRWGLFVDPYAECNLTDSALQGNQIGLVAYPGSAVTALSTRFLQNRRRTPSVGVYAGGVWARTGSSVTLRNCALYGNSQETGGAVYADHAAVTLAGCTIAGNTATAKAGGVYGSGSTITSVNSIVAFNGSGFSADPLAPGSFTLTGNDVYGNGGLDYDGLPAPDPSAGNLALDPLFSDATTGDLRLILGSPCIDAGRDACVLPMDRDVDGGPRIAGAHVDLGCYESPGQATLADAARALRLAGGLAAAGAGEPGADITTAAALARKALGL